MSTKPNPMPAASNDRGMYTDLVLMCLPLMAMATCFYGVRVLLLCGTGVITANLCDRVVALMRRQPYEKGEWSSEAFALLLTLLMPASVSYYVVIMGALAAVLLGKEAFGGYGAYVFHPAAVGYAVVAASWPQQLFSYPQPNLFTGLPLGSVSGVSLTESPSHILRAGGLPIIDSIDLVLGNYAGPMGSTMLLVVLACALYLLHRRRIGVVTPLCFLLACAAVAFFFPRVGGVGVAVPWQYMPERLAALKFEIASGGILYAAVFLINDPVNLPKSQVSRAVYGVVLGITAMMFRYYGTFETGVCFALLAVNSVSGWIDRAVLGFINRKGVIRREY